MSASRIFCPSCGAENKKQDRFCIACGGALLVAAPPVVARAAPTTEARKKGSNWPLLVTMGAVFILLLVVVVEAVVIVMSPGTVQEMGATLSAVDGKVFVQEGGQGNWMEVAEDFVIQAGDRIRVGGGSKALLTFLENTTTELRAFTELTVTELESVEGQPVAISLDLQLGEIWNRIGDLPAASLHEVTTVAARMISHGSEYGVAANGAGTTWLTGHEGEIEVTGGGQTVQLLPGDMLVVEPGSPPESYQEAVVALEEEEEEEEEPDISVDCALESIDLWSFGNEPLAEEYREPAETPTHTPTATATSRPTYTPTSTPTATATRISCPTLTIKLPSGAPPHLPFGIEWDVTGAPVPSGYGYTLDFSQDQASWQRASIWRIWPEGGYMHAEVQGPGEGNFYWRVCLVNMADPAGPSECCGPSHAIIHTRDEEPEEEGSYD
jgi:hypothetical protein